MTTLIFDQFGGGRAVVFDARRLLVAGYTGRDRDAVQAHINELASIGVPPPDTVPALFRLETDLLVQVPFVTVAGTATSGEVEPVVFRHEGELYLTVGSDHTDRALELEDIWRAKAACPKPIGTRCVALSSIGDWDSLRLRSSVDGGAVYQDGMLSALLPPADLLGHLASEGYPLADGDAVFCGTVPTIGAIRPSARFVASLSSGGSGDGLGGDGWVLGLAYEVLDPSHPFHRSGGPAPVSERGPSIVAKPELEFFDVAGVGWSPIPGGAPGLTERILATDSVSGVATRMLRFAPGTDTSAAGVLRHNFWEEVYILEGELHDLGLDEVFVAGTYACRPPGMPHGPWRSDTGCVTFEVRYPA